MSSVSQAIQIDLLPIPTIIEELDYETIYQELRDDFLSRDPKYTALVESDPALVLMQAFAYRELLLRQRMNDAARGVMLAYAIGSDLEHLGVLFGIGRREDETDEKLRQRIQQSLEAHTTAGSHGSYVYWGMSTESRESGGIKDIYVTSKHQITPGSVFITVLANNDGGMPNQALLDAVYDVLDNDVRPLTDQVFVFAPEHIYKYTVEATIYLYSRLDAETAPEIAKNSLTEYVTKNHFLGKDITVSGIYSSLHQNGVQDADYTVTVDGRILNADENIVVAPEEVAFCEEITVTIGGYRV